MTAAPGAIAPRGRPSEERAATWLPAAQKPRRYKTPRTIAALVMREMATTYGRSPGGYVWAILEPVGAIALLSAVFSLAFRSPALGDNFPLFYATAFLPFSLYTGLAGKIAGAIRFSKALLAYPAVTYTDAILARFVLNFTTQLLVFVIVIGGIAMVYDLRLVIDAQTALLGLVLAAAMGLGVGTLNCYLTSIMPIWDNVWSIAMRPLFVISGVFFIYDDMPASFREIIWWNPLFHITGLVRRAFYPTYDATYVSVPYVAVVASVLMFFGFLLLGRFHRDILSNR